MDHLLIVDAPHNLNLSCFCISQTFLYGLFVSKSALARPGTTGKPH